MRNFDASQEIEDKMEKDDKYIEERKYFKDYEHMTADEIGEEMIKITSKMESKWQELGNKTMIVDEEHRQDRLEYYKLKNVLMRRTVEYLLNNKEEE